MSRTYKDRPWRIRKENPHGIRERSIWLSARDIGELRKLNRRHDRVVQNQAVREGKEPPVIKKHNLWDAW